MLDTEGSSKQGTSIKRKYRFSDATNVIQNASSILWMRIFRRLASELYLDKNPEVIDFMKIRLPISICFVPANRRTEQF